MFCAVWVTEYITIIRLKRSIIVFKKMAHFINRFKEKIHTWARLRSITRSNREYRRSVIVVGPGIPERN